MSLKFGSHWCTETQMSLTKQIKKFSHKNQSFRLYCYEWVVRKCTIIILYHNYCEPSYNNVTLCTKIKNIFYCLRQKETHKQKINNQLKTYLQNEFCKTLKLELFGHHLIKISSEISVQ